MASNYKRLWLHDEDNTAKILPYTTLDAIKIQPDTTEDAFVDFEDDYDSTKNTITRNKSLADSALSSLNTRVTILENAGGGGGSESINLATPTADGLMSKEDKLKLNDIDDDANHYVLPKATVSNLGGVKVDGTSITVDNDGTIHSAAAGGGSVATLSDVDLDTVLNEDILQYNSTKHKWENVSLSTIESKMLDYVPATDIVNLFTTEDNEYEYDLSILEED